MAKTDQYTPMLRHYLEVKAQNPDALLLYRMGDFYEAFFEDAQIAAPVLEIALTARHRGSKNETPMCGVPHHALEVYLGKLLRAGFKVAICDQVENPAQAKGLVRREVVRVATPGTISEPALLDGKEENLLGSIVWEDGQGAGAFLDLSTAAFFVRRWSDEAECVDDLRALQPREILTNSQDLLPESVERKIREESVCHTEYSSDRWFDPRRAAENLERQFDVGTLRGFGLTDREPAVRAAAAALAYAQETQQSQLEHVNGIALQEDGSALVLDTTTLGNLEVFESLHRGAGRGSLLSVIDYSVSPGGGRLLKEWIRRPLRDVASIESRQDAVEEFLGLESERTSLRELLGQVADPERLLSRAVLATMTPREAATLRDSLELVPGIIGELQERGAGLLKDLATTDPLTDLQLELTRLLVQDPPASIKEGGVISPGVDDRLDRCRELAQDSKRLVLELQERERKKTGINSLKIRYNRVFGYYIEVTKANRDLVPEEYTRKQTLVNSERFITPDLKELEEAILSAEVEQFALEEEHFSRLKELVAGERERLGKLARSLAILDVVTAFSELAARRRYTRPQILAAGNPLQIENGRHPVVEQLMSEPFVPNDTFLGLDNATIVVLTGPNMGGKSTYLRQVALIVLMAQTGCFVPAEKATVGLVDRIFTRVGASDDLSRGESTFMVEMIETANILHQATSESLVILDEVGRGTATFDGLSLAWAIVEHLHETVKPKTLFATHYHELTELESLLDEVKNRTMAVKEWEDRIVFLRRVVDGSADKSYGLHVARLAGIPVSVIDRAAEILRNLEDQEYDLRGRPRLAQGEGSPQAEGPDQLRLFARPEEVVLSILKELDVERMTPLAALNLLQSLISRLRG